MSQKIRLKYEELAAVQLCHFSSLGVLAKSIFGGKKEPEKDYNIVGNSGDLEQDVAAIRQMLRVG